MVEAIEPEVNADLEAAPLSDGSIEDLAARLRIALVPLVRQLRRQGDPEHSVGVTSALSTVERHSPISVGDLARWERVSAPMVTKLVQAMETAGLVSRSTHPDDARISLVTATDAGRRYLHDQGRARTAWLVERMRGLDGVELSTLCHAIEIIERLSGMEDESPVTSSRGRER